MTTEELERWCRDGTIADHLTAELKPELERFRRFMAGDDRALTKEELPLLKQAGDILDDLAGAKNQDDRQRIVDRANASTMLQAMIVGFAEMAVRVHRGN